MKQYRYKYTMSLPGEKNYVLYIKILIMYPWKISYYRYIIERLLKQKQHQTVSLSAQHMLEAVANPFQHIL